VKQYFCSCCDRVFEKSTIFFSVSDGKRLLYLHKECVPVFSGGLGIGEIEEKMGVKIKNKVEIAIEGSVYWRRYRNGNLHKVGGPAAEWADGSKWWYRNGEIHREDGPAIVRASGTKQWYLYGTEFSEEEHAAEMKARKGK